MNTDIRNIMKKNFLKGSAIACSLFLITACGGNNTNEGDGSGKIFDRHMEQEDLSKAKVEDNIKGNENIEAFANSAPELQNQVKNLLNDYLQVKNALVESSAEGTSKAASRMLNNIKNFNTGNLPEEQESFYKQRVNGMQNDIRYLTQTNDVSRQRDHFALITRNTYALVKAFNPTEEAVYYQFCPMAFDNSGGYWLSAQEEIRNPYFGDKMLKCGRVEETIN